MTEDKHTTTAPAAGTGTYRFVIGFCVFCKLSDRRDPKEDRFRTGLTFFGMERFNDDTTTKEDLQPIRGLFFAGLNRILIF